jgi:hypothetical protein
MRLRAGEGPIPPVQSVGFVLPIERHSRTAISIKSGCVRICIENHSTRPPIPILMIVIKPAPFLTRFTVNETGRERFRIPVAPLHDTHLNPIRTHGAPDDPRFIDMPQKADHQIRKQQKPSGHTRKNNFPPTGHAYLITIRPPQWQLQRTTSLSASPFGFPSNSPSLTFDLAEVSRVQPTTDDSRAGLRL